MESLRLAAERLSLAKEMLEAAAATLLLAAGWLLSNRQGSRRSARTLQGQAPF